MTSLQHSSNQSGSLLDAVNPQGRRSQQGIHSWCSMLGKSSLLGSRPEQQPQMGKSSHCYNTLSMREHLFGSPGYCKSLMDMVCSELTHQDRNCLQGMAPWCLDRCRQIRQDTLLVGVHCHRLDNMCLGCSR